MTCYFRHLTEVFANAGIHVTSENRVKLDKIIHEIVGVEYKDCSAAWKEVKKQMAENEGAFVLKLKEKWSKQTG